MTETMAESSDPSGTRYPRTHEILSPDGTRDPIFLFQEKVISFLENFLYTWDSDRGILMDVNYQEVPTARALEEGIAVATWRTVTVFLTRQEGDDWGKAHDYRFADGWRVYCVAATGALIDTLAKATEGGRYR